MYAINTFGKNQIWISDKQREKVVKLLQNAECPQFLEINGQLINKSSIEGIYDEGLVEDTNMSKSHYLCIHDRWTPFGQQCSCYESYIKYGDKLPDDTCKRILKKKLENGKLQLPQ